MSASSAHAASSAAAAMAKLPSLGTGATALGNWCHTRRRSARMKSIVWPVGSSRRVVSR